VEDHLAAVISRDVEMLIEEFDPLLPAPLRWGCEADDEKKSNAGAEQPGHEGTSTGNAKPRAKRAPGIG